MDSVSTAPLPASAGPTCSDAWAGLSAWGTATQASFWIALEQPGPWGAKAFTQSRLDPTLGGEVERRTLEAGGRALLIRAPGNKARPAGRRRVFVAGNLAGTPWLRTGEVDDPAEILDLPFEVLDRPDPVDADWLRPSDPVLLVCTNAKRDRCCALKGLPLAEQLAAEGLPVWECSHTGGHRFAPTGVVLPTGQLIGRLTADLGRQALEAAARDELAIGTLNEEHDRGLSHLPPRESAAVSWVRSHTFITPVVGLATQDTGDAVVVTHLDGRQWRLDVTQETGPDLIDSCAKPPKPSQTWTVRPAT
ncbi:sucrase ferredoxin [Nigerium massiliense]|uniref:sucrase ferredoxin n=1 Tax=Nigerium massiliense TaxID=1522317 RepID=UPI00069502F4|nr:sucrase ferredoxin [Nigerium massiliense]